MNVSRRPRSADALRMPITKPRQREHAGPRQRTRRPDSILGGSIPSGDNRPTKKPMMLPTAAITIGQSTTNIASQPSLPRESAAAAGERYGLRCSEGESVHGLIRRATVAAELFQCKRAGRRVAKPSPAPGRCSVVPRSRKP